MGMDAIFPMTPLGDPTACQIVCLPGPPPCEGATCDFEAAVQALTPDVYWRMDDAVTTGDCTDYSGNNRHGFYDIPANLTPLQGSVVPADPTAVSVAVASVAYPTAATVHDITGVPDTDDWWDTANPSFSLCIKRTAPIVNDTTHILGRVRLNQQVMYWLKFISDGNIELRYKLATDCSEEFVLTTTLLNLADANPHIITCVIDPLGRGSEIWVDCVLEASLAGGPMCNTSDFFRAFFVGGNTTSGSSTLGGDMSHFIFGKRVWTAQEITNLQCVWKCE